MGRGEMRRGGPMGKVWAFLKRVWFAAFGRVNWDAPPWARGIGRGGQWMWAHKLKSLGALAVMAGLSTGGYFGWQAWKNRPRPEMTHVSLSAPAPTTFDEGKPRPNPVRIEFDHSAAPLKNVNKKVTAGVEISPKIEGAWTWESDKELVFAPKNDWPVGEDYTVR